MFPISHHTDEETGGSRKTPLLEDDSHKMHRYEVQHALESDFLATQDDQDDHIEMKQQEDFMPLPQSQDESNLKNATGVSTASVHVEKLIENVKTLQNKGSNRKLSESIRDEGFSGGFTNFVSTRKVLVLSAVLVLTYLVAGTVILAIWVKGDEDEGLPDWNAIDAFYFTMLTLLTIGYGDINLQTRGQRFFGIFFIIVGIMVIGGVVFNIITDYIVTSFENKRKESVEKLTQSIGQKQSIPKCKCGVGADVLQLLIYGGLIVGPAIAIGHFEDWKITESIYWAVVTATTLGYGDYAPTLMWTRFAACFYMPMAVTCMGLVFAKVTNAYLDKKANESRKEFLDRKLTPADLRQMDVGDDNKVNFEEFLIFTLAALGKISSDDIQEIHEAFDRLDVDNDGELDISEAVGGVCGTDEYKQDLLQKSHAYAHQGSSGLSQKSLMTGDIERS